jgi:hypothetical protein
VPIPKPEDVQMNQQLQQQIQGFKSACELIKSDIRRVSVIQIETDSTLAADQEAEREDRAKFLAAAGAFLQQAVPAMEATPELGPLLGAMLMFTIRTFPSSRPVEDEFEKVQMAMANRQPNPDKDGKQAAAQAAAQKAQADSQAKQQELQIRAQEAQGKSQAEQTRISNEGIAEQNRHQEKMQELDLKLQELRVREREVRIKEQLERTERFTALHQAAMAELGAEQQAETDFKEEKVEYAHLDDAEAERTHEADQQEAQHGHELELQQNDQQAAQDAQEREIEAAPDPASPEEA